MFGDLASKADIVISNDADFDALEGKVSAITPVPGGVGSVTTALLMYHVARAAASAETAPETVSK